MLHILKKKLFLVTLLLLFFLIFLYCSKHFFIVHKIKSEPLKYEEMNKKINTKNFNDLNQIENFIIKNKNIYGTLISLSLSKKYIAYNDFEKAFIQLNNSLKYTKDENLKIILKIRMAKIKMQKLEYQEAINILESIRNHNWENIISNMKGDIFLSMNQQNKAIKYWKKSMSLENSNISKEIIIMKLNELKK